MDVIVRPAQPADAEKVIEYVQQLAEEPGVYIALSPGEFNITPEEERQTFLDMAASDNSLFLVAEVDGQIIGTLTCRGGHRLATRHVASIGLSVARGWRRQGIGSQLMEHLIDWAESSGVVTRIELDVFAQNEPAIQLYKKYGFEVEGTRRRAIYKDGKYSHDLVMALLL